MRKLQLENPSGFDDVIRSTTFQSQFVRSIEYLEKDALAVFVELGVDLNRHDCHGIAPSGSYPLSYCISDNDIEKLTTLLELGADPNVCDALDAVSYMEQGSEAQIALCELFLKFGADINKELDNLPGYTPICRAIDHGHDELVAFMVSKGAQLPEDSESQPPSLNLETFQSRLEKACRDCWNSVREKHPDENFCLFGLETDSDFVILNPLFDSEGAVDRDQSNRRKSDFYVARISLDSDSEFYGSGREFLDELSSEMNSCYGIEESKRERMDRIRTLFGIFESTLQNLDQEGLFGNDADREGIILMISIIDADDAEWKTMLKTAKKLNPPVVFKQFKASLK